MLQYFYVRVSLSPEEAQFADRLADIFDIVEPVEGVRGAARFVVRLAKEADELLAAAYDYSFCNDNGIDPLSV